MNILPDGLNVVIYLQTIKEIFSKLKYFAVPVVLSEINTPSNAIILRFCSQTHPPPPPFLVRKDYVRVG